MLEPHLAFCLNFAKLRGRGREGIWTDRSNYRKEHFKELQG